MDPLKIEESFIALKAVQGAYTAPLAPLFSYRSMMDRKWHRDPQLMPRKGWSEQDVMLCSRGFHIFPLSRLDDWWSESTDYYHQDEDRHIWVVEVSGYAVFDRAKGAASQLRFMNKLTKTELELIQNSGLATSSWTPQSQGKFRSVTEQLGFDGLVMCQLAEATVSGGPYAQYGYRPRLLDVSS